MIHLRLLGGVELTARDSGRERRLVLAPKPLALLAYLAVARAEERPVRRDVLLALFWPDLSSTRARAALRQALFQLRRGVGAGGLETGRNFIALSAEAISSDIVEFERCLARGDRAAAMEIYRGPLLQGFFVDGASSELEAWMEHARTHCASKAFQACSELADEAAQSRNGIAAAQWARMAVSLAPDNEIAVRRLIQTLDTFGDRAGALRVAADFSRWFSEEFGASPSAETQALMAAVRARCPVTNAADQVTADLSSSLNAVAPIAPSTAPPEPADQAPIQLASRRRPMLFRRGLVVAATLIFGVGLVAMIATRTSHGATPSTGVAGDGTSPSITIASSGARRLYAEGMRRYLGGDPRESARLFVAALADDSTCAMCAYYAALSYSNFDDADAARNLEIAMRLANRVSEPERLLIHFRWADATNSVSRSAVAESLVTRYAYWPEAQMAAAEADQMAGRWLAAAAHLRRVIAARPLPDSTADGACSVCSAQLSLAGIYEAADSLPAALRVVQGLVRMRPHSRLGWLELSHVLAKSGRYDEARAAMDTSTRYASGSADDVIEHAQIEMRAGNFAVADRLLTSVAQAGNDNSRFASLWFLVISLRAQGRLHEALEIAQGPMRSVEPSTTQGIGESVLAQAQLLFELGQYRRAATLFAQQSFPPDSFARSAIGRVARQRSWTLTHAGSALAAAGDTVALSALVDTVKWWGARSGFGRDPRLYHYLQGLMWMARARPESAVADFRRGLSSESEGFSRLDLQLARCLMALGRPREAIPLLQHPLAGTLEAGNFYTSRTELQETLAEAYDAAGEPDSAAVYYRDALRAWRRADAQFQPVIERVRVRLATDERLLASRH